jgi:hypothetical protein
MARRGRIGVPLTWAAAGVAGVAALVSLILAGRMDDLFDAAVAEDRVFPFTGEADEQALFPGLLGCAFIVVAIATAALAYQLQGWVNEGQHIGWVVPSAALVGVLVVGVPLALPISSFADSQYTYDLYGWWYIPFLTGAMVAYGCCLAAAVVGLIRRRAGH